MVFVSTDYRSDRKMFYSNGARRVSMATSLSWSASAATHVLVALFLLQLYARPKQFSILAEDQSTVGIRIKRFVPITYYPDWADTILCSITPKPIKDLGIVDTAAKCARICADYDWPCTMINVFPFPGNKSVRCQLHNYQSVDLFLPVSNCTGLKVSQLCHKIGS